MEGSQASKCAPPRKRRSITGRSRIGRSTCERIGSLSESVISAHAVGVPVSLCCRAPLRCSVNSPRPAPPCPARVRCPRRHRTSVRSACFSSVQRDAPFPFSLFFLSPSSLLAMAPTLIRFVLGAVLAAALVSGAAAQFCVGVGSRAFYYNNSVRVKEKKRTGDASGN
jgi:hypothetical protein